MAKDLKFIVKSVASNDFITGVVLFLGFKISMLNLIISATIT